MVTIKYCKKPLELPGDVGLWEHGIFQRTIFYNPKDFEGTGFGCGTWYDHELCEDKSFTYYTCRRCLQEQGLLW